VSGLYGQALCASIENFALSPIEDREGDQISGVDLALSRAVIPILALGSVFPVWIFAFDRIAKTPHTLPESAPELR
jgi:hypothetical protein